MAQFSMEISRPTGSVPRENQHAVLLDRGGTTDNTLILYGELAVRVHGRGAGEFAALVDRQHTLGETASVLAIAGSGTIDVEGAVCWFSRGTEPVGRLISIEN